MLGGNDADGGCKLDEKSVGASRVEVEVPAGK